jgi:hypothetical protein
MLRPKYIAHVELDTARRDGRVPDREGFWFYFSASEADAHDRADAGAWYCAISGYLVRPGVASDRLYLIFSASRRGSHDMGTSRPFRRTGSAELARFLRATIIEFEDGRSKLWQRCGWKLDVSAQTLCERLDHHHLLASLRKWETAPSLLLHIERRLKSPGDAAPGLDDDALERETITALVQCRGPARPACSAARSKTGDRLHPR